MSIHWKLSAKKDSLMVKDRVAMSDQQMVIVTELAGTDEEVDENTMQFEPVDESIAGGIEIEGNDSDDYDDEDEEDFGRPKFSKDIVSIPMPDKLDNIVEYIPEGGITSRIYNYDEEEPIDDDDDEDIDFDNIIDENGQLTLKDTDAFERKLDEEFDEMFKRLGLDQDDL